MEKLLHLSKIVRLKNNQEILLRPLKPNDSLKEFFLSCSKESIFYRFMSSAFYINVRKLASSSLLTEYTNLDLDQHMSIVAVVEEDGEEKIIAEGRFFRARPEIAEVALITADGWQRLGLATYIGDFLKEIALSRDIKYFEGDILVSNRKMLNVFRYLKIKYTRTLYYDSIHFRIILDDPYLE